MSGRRVALWTCAVIASGCGDPSIAIDVSLPQAYQSRIDTISLRVLTPPESVADCDALAYGELTADTITASLIAETSVSAASYFAGEANGDLDVAAVPRKGRKLFWLDARDSEGLVIAASCVAVETVTDQTSIALEGEIATTITVDNLNPLGGSELPNEITGIISTIGVGEGDAPIPLVGAELRWQLDGPAGQSDQSSVASVSGGRFGFNPGESDLPGPSSLILRTRWNNTGAAPQFAAFKEAPILAEDSFPLNREALGRFVEATYVVGRIGPTGEPGLATVAHEEGTLNQWRVLTYLWNGSTLSLASTTNTIVGVRALGLANNGSRDQVTAFVNAGWLSINPTTGAITTNPAPFDLGGEVVRRMFPAGRCDSPNDRLLVVTSSAAGDSPGRWAVVGADGSLVPGTLTTTEPTASFVATGCVTTTGGSTERAALVRDSDRFAVFVFGDSPAAGRLSSIAIESVGFSKAVGDTSERILTTELTLSGTIIARNRLALIADDRVDLDREATIETPTLIRATTGGDLDGDEVFDIAGLIALGSGVPRLFVYLGAGDIIGFSPELDGLEIIGAGVWLYDLDDDGDDDILIGTSSGFRALRMGD